MLDIVLGEIINTESEEKGKPLSIYKVKSFLIGGLVMVCDIALSRSGTLFARSAASPSSKHINKTLAVILVNKQQGRQQSSSCIFSYQLIT